MRQQFYKCYDNLEIFKLLWPIFMAYPHCCTCTDSPIMGTGSNKVNRQLASFWQLLVVYCSSAACGWPAYIWVIRDVRNFNMLLNMSDHVLIYCSCGQGTQKKIQHSTHSGNSGTSHAHFLAIPLTGKIMKIALFTMMQLFNCLNTLFLQWGGGGQPHFTSFYLIPILPFLAARMR